LGYLDLSKFATLARPSHGDENHRADEGGDPRDEGRDVGGEELAATTSTNHEEIPGKSAAIRTSAPRGSSPFFCVVKKKLQFVVIISTEHCFLFQ